MAEYPDKVRVSLPVAVAYDRFARIPKEKLINYINQFCARLEKLFGLTALLGYARDLEINTQGITATHC